MKQQRSNLWTVLTLVGIALLLSTSPAKGAATTAVLGNGVCINEILIDPNSSTANFDTDGNGTADDCDEFVELYNTSTSTIDISGWELWDAGVLKWFTFPGSADDGTTLLAPGAYAVVVVSVQSGGSLPTMTNPDSLAFDAAQGSSLINNTKDNVVLYDPGEDEYIQLIYNGAAVEDPTSGYPGFSATAARIGDVEDFGNDEDGKSLTRYPSGDTNVMVHDSIPGAGNASPNAVNITNLRGAQKPTVNPMTGAAIALLIAAALLFTYTLTKEH